jgi:hypothetical protein
MKLLDIKSLAKSALYYCRIYKPQGLNNEALRVPKINYLRKFISIKKTGAGNFIGLHLSLLKQREYDRCALLYSYSIEKRVNFWGYGLALIDSIKFIPTSLLNLKILEIGTGRGFSSAIFSLATDQRFESVTIDTVDILPVDKVTYWNSFSDYEGPKTRKMFNNFYHKNVNFYEGSSLSFMKNVIDQGGKYNFIFLDGSHTYFEVCKELWLALKIIEKGGVVLLDDYDKSFEGVVRAVDEFVKAGEFEVLKCYSSNIKTMVLLKSL